MTATRFLFGLSGGVLVFAMGGPFWSGLGISAALKGRSEWWMWLTATFVQFGGAAALVWASVRLRKRSGFSAAARRQPDVREQAEGRHIRKRFLLVSLGQGLLVGAGVWWFEREGLHDSTWAWIALIVSLHFAPLGDLFHVRAYYWTAALGALVGLAALGGIFVPYTTTYLCIAMTVVMWGTGAYIAWRADALTAGALREPWAT